jgi:Tfp pilus assembly protein PilO
MNRNITALILIVLAIGVYFTYTSGQIAVINSIQAENNQYLSAITNAKKLIDLRDSVLKQYNAISDADKSRLDKIVPNNIDNIRLMIDISGIASRHGITASGITTSADTNASNSGSTQSASVPANPAASYNSGLSTVTVSFSVTTTYNNFIAFLQDIERSLRILDVTSITLSPSTNGTYTYGVTLDTYWLKQ